MRGIAGNPADSDRDIGFKKALAEYPKIEVVPTAEGVFTKWDSATATQLMNDFIASGEYDKIQGIWTSGMDGEIVEPIKAANKPFVPIVGADRGVFVKPLLDPTNYEGLTGAAVTNTAAVGGAGIALALKLLNGETIATDPTAPKPNTVLLKPVVADNLTDAGKTELEFLARRRPQRGLAARPPDRRLDHVHPRAGCRLQGSERVVLPPG